MKCHEVVTFILTEKPFHLEVAIARSTPCGGALGALIYVVMACISRMTTGDVKVC